MIDKKLLKEIQDYVKLNELGDVNVYVNNLLKNAFMLDKYGDRPDLNNEKAVVKESITTTQVQEDDIVETKSEIIKNTDIYNE